MVVVSVGRAGISPVYDQQEPIAVLKESGELSESRLKSESNSGRFALQCLCNALRTAS